MKKLDTTTTTKRDFDELISKFSENEILDLHAMNQVRGGDGDGGGSIIIIPKKEGQSVKSPKDKGALKIALFFLVFWDYSDFFSEIVT